MERSSVRRPILVAAALQILTGPWCQAAMAVQPIQLPVQVGAPLSGAAAVGASLGRPGAGGVSLISQTPGSTRSLPALQNPALSQTPTLMLPAPAASLQTAAPLAAAQTPGAAPTATRAARLRPATRPAGVLSPAPALSAVAGAVRTENILLHGPCRSIAAGAAPSAALLPRIDFSAFSPESLGRMPAAGARDAGERLMDQVLGIRNGVRKGAVDGTKAPAVSNKKGPGLKKGEPVVDGAPLGAAKKPFDPMNRPFSPYRLSMFEYDPEAYALTFLFGKEDKSSPQGYELLIGLAVHQTLEKVYTWIAQGRDGKSITREEVLAEYDAAWAKEKAAAGRYRVRDGWTDADYKRRGRAFIARKFELLAPFDGQGQVLSLEQTVLWKMTDPVTGKSYDFKGKIDRLMLKGDTVYIRDWKTYFNPPSLAKLERDDYQLGLYALALRAARPDLVQGRKIKLVWDYKEFTQEIAVDDAYLAKVQDRVFHILRAIETFKERVEAERPEWEKRLKPDARPSGLQAAKQAVDRMGAIQAELADKKEELRKLDKEYGKLEAGLARYGKEQGLDAVQGQSYSATIERRSERTVPTKTDDPEGNEAVVQVLREGGVWEKYSSLDAAAVRRMAELQGGEDRAAFEKLRADLRSEHAHGLEVSAKDEAGKGKGGVARTKLPREAWAPDAEPGLLSATQLATFLADREDYVKRYLLRMRDLGPKPMGFLAGSAIHETMERLYVWIKGGKIAADLTLADLLKYFTGRWKELRAEGDFRPDPGVTPEEYQRGAKDYIRAKWKQLFPFDDQGRVLYLEQRMHFALTDPRTGRTYKFQGIPDRVMMDGDTIVIRDWKSHYKAPTDEEVKAKDYQLGLYLLAMRQLYPDLMRGKKGRLIWDFKEKETVIEVDDAYLADLEKRLFAVLREMDSLRTDFDANRAAWEDRLKPPDLPKNRAEAGARVDRMGELAVKMKTLDGAVKALKAESAELEEVVVEFSRRTGHVRVAGRSHASRLTKKGAVSVPTQGKEKEAYDRVVAILKDAGVWSKYSKMEYRALKKAMADPKNPDREILKKVEPLLREVRSTTVSLSDLSG